MDRYIQSSKDYNLSSEQKLQYLHNSPCNDALCFIFPLFSSISVPLKKINQMGDEYNTAVRQIRVKTYLSSLRVSTVLSKGSEIFVALAIVYKIILEMSRQGPP